MVKQGAEPGLFWPQGMAADPTNTHLAAISLIFRTPRWKAPEHVRVFQTEMDRFCCFR